MKKLILVAAVFVVSGCATLSKEEIAGCQGDQMCITSLIETKEYEREDRRIRRYEKALARYNYLEEKCPAGGVAVKCDQISKACGRTYRKTALLSVWELESAGCTANMIWY